ncbi:MAG: zinc ribbon domain-containing protein [Anaerolineae bacterium]|nr:zinc ribbon domain-containing protein [Anaerolineae bacterium]
MNANGFDTIECPNCGGANFEGIAPGRHRCVYCGTVLTSREPERPPDLVRCPYCGYENARAARYCNQCGKRLPGWLNALFKNTDPGAISLVVTLVGTFVFPFPLASPIVGLVLGYRALKSAREGGGNSEKLARAAVITGWAVLACTMLPLCFVFGSSGVQAAYSACDGLGRALLDMLSGVGQ